MKTKPPLKIFKLPALAPLGIAIAAALVTQPMRAGVIVNNIVITETSSSTLTATYNGSTSGVSVNFLNFDSWGLAFSSVTFHPGTVSWIEPGNSALLNSFSTGSLHFAQLVSDNARGIGGVANGTTVDNVGTDNVDRGTVNVTFFDKGDVATTPDAGTTGSLFGLSLTGLAFLRRKLG